jgi:hypothetical protein
MKSRKRGRIGPRALPMEGCSAVYGFVAAQTVTPPPGWARSFAPVAMLALAFLICAQNADARLKSEWRFGGSMFHSYKPLSATSNMFGDPTPRGDSRLVYAGQPSYAGGSLMGLFSRPGPVGGFAAGFLGAGVLGLLFGHGVLGELSGLDSFVGLAFQITLIVMLARLIWSWWYTDKLATVVDLSPRQLADAYGRPRNEVWPDIDAGMSADAARDKTKTDAFKNR